MNPRARLTLFVANDPENAPIGEDPALESLEDRIAALRAQIDRITSRQMIEQRTVQAQLDQLLEQQIMLPISMNLSAQDLENPALINSILQHEQKYASAQRVKFELAESALAPDAPAVQKSLQLLKQAGSTLVMDDFGAGQHHQQVRCRADMAHGAAAAMAMASGTRFRQAHSNTMRSRSIKPSKLNFNRPNRSPSCGSAPAK